MEAVIERVRQRGRGRRYDCVVGLSGGRDSTYLAWLLVRRHKLRCLATYYRTPFTQDRTDANVRRAAARLQIPLVELELPAGQHLSAARTFFLLWQSNPIPEYANLTCAGCKLLFRELFREARKQRVATIVCGANEFENVQFLPTYRKTTGASHVDSLRTQFGKMLRVIRRGLPLLSKVPPRLLPLGLQASLLYINPHTPYLKLRFRDLLTVDYFHHTGWNEAECLTTVQSELGWEPPPGAADTWKADCDFAALKNYMFFKTTGITYNDAFYSNLIRAGQMDRSEALRRIQLGAGLDRGCIRSAMEQMGLPADQLDHGALERARRV